MQKGLWGHSKEGDLHTKERGPWRGDSVTSESGTSGTGGVNMKVLSPLFEDMPLLGDL